MGSRRRKEDKGSVTMNIVGIALLIVFVLCALAGLKKGLVRMFSGLLATIISLVLVYFLLPYTTTLLREQTPVYEYLTRTIDSTIIEIAGKNAVKKESASIDRDKVRELLYQYGMDGAVVDTYSDSQLSELVDQYFAQYKDQITQAVSDSLDTLSRIDQTRLIRSLPIPSFLQSMMENYNNSEGYRKLGVTDFSGYLAGFLSGLVLNVLAFLVTLVLTWLIVRLILAALDLVSRFPIIHQANRIGGLLAGAVEGLLVCWLILLVISMLSGTKIGEEAMRQINSSPVLRSVYDWNALLGIVQSSVRSIFGA